MHVVLKALAMSMLLVRIKPRFIFEGHAEDLSSLRQDVKVLYRKRQKSTRKIFCVIVWNAAWLCNLELQTGKQFFKSSPVAVATDSMFIEIRNKRICVCSYLSRKYSVLFSLVDCLKVKCNVVFLKIHEECKTNVMWSSSSL